ncbi:hypothetical protein SPI_00161 [Niveomyces insectorum RCEF 264]|uniref:Uncharacterized protein n=1 Tax=Niveomyces insectorum RCEF 264 TaxID=1081102 RepID=A0A167ZW54_9HYPO|nr:hypothetical protein SPI_00161 [Niveomyces insectorum RCEF 264]
MVEPVTTYEDLNVRVDPQLRLLFCTLCPPVSFPIAPKFRSYYEHRRRNHPLHQGAVRSTEFHRVLANVVLDDPATKERLMDGSDVLACLPVFKRAGKAFQRFHRTGREWMVKESDESDESEDESPTLPPGTERPPPDTDGPTNEDGGETVASPLRPVHEPRTATQPSDGGGTVVETVRRLTSGRLSRKDTTRFLKHLAAPPHSGTRLCQDPIPLRELSNEGRWQQAATTGLRFNIVPIFDNAHDDDDDNDDNDDKGRWFVTVIHLGTANHAITFDFVDHAHNDSFSLVRAYYAKQGVDIRAHLLVKVLPPREGEIDGRVSILDHVKQFLQDPENALRALLLGDETFSWTANPGQVREELLRLDVPAFYNAQKKGAAVLAATTQASEGENADFLCSRLEQLRSALSNLRYQHPSEHDALVEQLPRVTIQAVLHPAHHTSSQTRTNTHIPQRPAATPVSLRPAVPPASPASNRTTPTLSASTSTSTPLQQHGGSRKHLLPGDPTSQTKRQQGANAFETGESNANVNVLPDIASLLRNEHEDSFSENTHRHPQHATVPPLPASPHGRQQASLTIPVGHGGHSIWAYNNPPTTATIPLHAHTSFPDHGHPPILPSSVISNLPLPSTLLQNTRQAQQIRPMHSELPVPTPTAFGPHPDTFLHPSSFSSAADITAAAASLAFDNPEQLASMDAHEHDFVHKHRYLCYQCPQYPSLVVYEEAVRFLPRTGWVGRLLSGNPAVCGYPEGIHTLSRCIDLGLQQVQNGEEFFSECKPIQGDVYMRTHRAGRNDVFRAGAWWWEHSVFKIPRNSTGYFLFGCRFTRLGDIDLGFVREWDAVTEVYVTPRHDGAVLLAVSVAGDAGYGLARRLLAV